MTIGKKLFSLQAVMMATLVIVVAASWVTINNLGNLLIEVIMGSGRAVELSQAIGKSIYEMQSAARGAQLSMVNDDSSALTRNTDNFDSARSRLSQQFEEIQPLLTSEQGKGALRELQQGLAAWEPLHRHPIRLS